MQYTIEVTIAKTKYDSKTATAKAEIEAENLNLQTLQEVTSALVIGVHGKASKFTMSTPSDKVESIETGAGESV